MRMNNIWAKSIALLLVFSLLLGVGLDNWVQAAETTTTIPRELKDYTRITMESFGLTASTDEAGTPYPNAVEGVYTGETLDKTYLDVDVNFNGCEDGTRYFQYLYEGDWTQFMRAAHWGSGMSAYEGANSSNSLWITEASNKAFFNLKLAVDMTANASDVTKLDIKMQVWVNNGYEGEITFTASAGVLKQIYTSAGITYRTPVMKENIEPEEPTDSNLPAELKDYTRVTLDKFGLDATTNDAGTKYATQKENSYTGATLNKTYLDVDVNFHGSTGGSYFQYLHKSDWTQYLRVIHYGDGLSSYEGANSANSIWMTNVPNDKFFNLKMAVDMVANASNGSLSDITLQIWIDNVLQGTIQFTANADELKNVYIVGSEESPISFRTPRVEGAVNTTLADVSYELSSGKGYLLTGEGKLYVNNVETAAGTVFQMPGDYVITRVTRAGYVFSQNVSLYQIGDVHLDGEEEWTDEDRLDLEKVISGDITSKAAIKAADLNNDGKVAESDLALMEKVIHGDLEKDTVLKKYHPPAVTYDFLGGDSVMPIGGYYGPYTETNVTESIYKAIADSGVNLIAKTNLDYQNEGQQSLIHKGLALAEKYGIGVYVSDARLNSIITSGKYVTEHHYVSDRIEMADLLGDYSIYQSYLGNMIVDEPVANIEDGWKNWHADRLERFKWYEDITEALSSYDNLIGYVNLLGQYHMQQGSGYKYIEYEDYLRSIGKSTKLLSFDSYPFYEKKVSSGGLIPYLKSLGTISKVAREDGYPFWSCIQAGTDFRDDGSEGTTSGYLTQAQTLWNVNTSLAFGAKGIVYFPLIQPTFFANVDTSAGTYDYNRNGIIGADNNKNNYYAMVKEANKQVSAVDEVLMKSLNQGVVVTGQAVMDTEDVENVHTSLATLKTIDGLTAVSGDDAMVGCFTYGDQEAFYVVSYDYAASEEQVITLTFDGNHQYRIIQAGVTTYGEGSTCTINATAGEGVLVVLEDHIVYYENISAYRVESGYTAPEAPAGYIFAGWYKDKACTKKNAVRKNETEVGAYAKFVDSNLLTVKAQVVAGTTMNSDKTNIRFVTAVNDLNYAKVGFRIIIHKKSGPDVRDCVDNIVYTTMSALVGDEEWKYTPQELFCGTAVCFKAWIIQNIPKTSFDTEFEVTPYWETLDGTVVYGATVIKTVRQGIQ